MQNRRVKLFQEGILPQAPIKPRPAQAVATIPSNVVHKQRRPPTPEAETIREKQKNQLAVVDAGDAYSHAMQDIYGKRVDAIDKKLGLHSSLGKQPRISSGLLSVDLMLGNGFVPGFNVFFGAEQSAKSTASMHALWSSLQSPIPVRKYFDAEGAIDRRYTGNILQTDSWDDVFGSRGRNGWIKRPNCGYYDNNIIETVFRDMHRTASFMPDKVFNEELNEWFLVFDRSNDHKHLIKELLSKGVISAPDTTLFKSTGAYWCSVGDDDSPQAVFFLDSLPSLSPEKIDEEQMSDAGLGIDARYLGKYMKLLRGKLRPKGIILLAVNQLRDRPMAGPGQLPYYEPAGNAVKFACMSGDTRIITENGMLRADEFERDPKGKILTTDGMQTPKGFAYMGRKALAEVTLSNGQMLRCSHDHALLTYSSSRKEPEVFVKARDLGRCYVKTYIGADIWSSNYLRLDSPESTSYALDHGVSGSKCPTLVDAQLGRWMGLMTGDGSYCRKSVSYSSIDSECEEYVNLTESLFDYSPTISYKEHHASVCFRVWSIQQTLRMLGMTQCGVKKRVPEAIFRSPRDVVLAYLTGLFTADGNFSKGGVASLSTISGQLAHDVQLLLNNLGCEAILEKNKFKGGFSTGKSRNRWNYTVWLTRIGTERLIVLCDFSEYKLRNMPPVTNRNTSKMGFPELRGWQAFGTKLLEKLETLDGLKPSRLETHKAHLYAWAESLRTLHERESVLGDLDSIYKLVTEYNQGYRWYAIRSVELNHAAEPTYDGSMPTHHTIISNGIVCHNSDTRSMWTSRVPQDDFPRPQDNKGICAEPSVEFDNGMDFYAFKGCMNVKNKYGQPFRKTGGRVWIKDGEGEPRGFDPVYDVYRFLCTVGAIDGPITEVGRKKFFINLKPIKDVQWNWTMFKTLVIGQYDNNRRLLGKARDLGAPNFRLRDYCLKLLTSGRTEDMLAFQARAETKKGGVDLEAEDGEGDDE